MRLSKYAYEFGLIDDEAFSKIRHKIEVLESESLRLKSTTKHIEGRVISLKSLLSRPEVTYESLITEMPEHFFDHGEEINTQIEINLKYEGYIGRQAKEIEKLQTLDPIKIPKNFDYSKVVSLSTESRNRLCKIMPENVGQASRLEGVSIADISILLIALKK